MAIEFQCTCGKALRVKDEHGGKKARCPACQKVLFVPPPLELREPEPIELKPADTGPKVPCPSCGVPIPADAVVCVTCGYNAKTGKHTETKLEAVRRRGGLPIAIPTGKLAAAAVVLVLLGVGWFCVAAPVMTSLAVSNAVGYVTNGDLQKAIAEFKAIRPKANASHRERIDLWIDQLKLERTNNTGSTLSEGKLIGCEGLRMKVAKKPFSGGAIMMAIELDNRSDEPFTVRNDHFYLRGLSDMVLAADHADSSVDGIVVPPGETREGLVAFRKVPDHPVHRRIGRQTQTAYYILFNDGQRYVKCMLPF